MLLISYRNRQACIVQLNALSHYRLSIHHFQNSLPSGGLYQGPWQGHGLRLAFLRL